MENTNTVSPRGSTGGPELAGLLTALVWAFVALVVVFLVLEIVAFALIAGAIVLGAWLGADRGPRPLYHQARDFEKEKQAHLANTPPEMHQLIEEHFNQKRDDLYRPEEHAPIQPALINLDLDKAKVVGKAI